MGAFYITSRLSSFNADQRVRDESVRICCVMHLPLTNHAPSRELVHTFRQKTLVLVKALMLQKKVRPNLRILALQTLTRNHL
jgi:hypothetical protein